jgi:hypothetical protein
MRVDARVPRRRGNATFALVDARIERLVVYSARDVVGEATRLANIASSISPLSCARACEANYEVKFG